MKQVLFLLLFVGLGSSFLQAQPVLTPRNMALGGGGSTYITDYNANFYNPANLMIQDREGMFSFGIGAAALRFDPASNHSDLKAQRQNIRDHINVYTPGDFEFEAGERSEILENNYPGDNLISDNSIRYDATLVGLKWLRNNRAFSVVLRTRTSSNYQVGKGWYSDNFEQTGDDTFTRNQTLIHRYQSLHEVSFGYAESFQFLTGLTPRLDNFIIGIAPKLVLGGGYQNAVWNNVYQRQDVGTTAQRLQNFTFDAAGDFGNVISSAQRGVALNNAIQTSFSDDPFEISGIGAGLDIGVTYLITLGSDLSAINSNQQPTNSSLRLSFSMTDIGFISYGENSISFRTPTDTTNVNSGVGEISNVNFIGARGQYSYFVQQFGEDNPFLSANQSQSTFSTLLPMALHGGALLELNRIKLMGDLSIGLTNNAFNSTTAFSSFGIELRPLLFLPIRGGIQFKGQRPKFLSIGTAIETKRWLFSISASISPESVGNQPEFKGTAVSALQFYF